MGDNLTIRGKIDRIFVSRTEYWEVNYFVEHYLSTRKYELSDKNRKIVKDKIDSYEGRAPILREDMSAFLDRQFQR